MKKAYIKPEVQNIRVEVEEGMLTSSLGIDKNTSVGGSQMLNLDDEDIQEWKSDVNIWE